MGVVTKFRGIHSTDYGAASLQSDGSVVMEIWQILFAGETWGIGVVTEFPQIHSSDAREFVKRESFFGLRIFQNAAVSVLPAVGAAALQTDGGVVTEIRKERPTTVFL